MRWHRAAPPCKCNDPSFTDCYESMDRCILPRRGVITPHLPGEEVAELKYTGLEDEARGGASGGCD